MKNNTIKGTYPWNSIDAESIPVINISDKKITWNTGGLTSEFKRMRRYCLEAAEDLYGNTAVEEIKKISANSEDEWLTLASKINRKYRRAFL